MEVNFVTNAYTSTLFFLASQGPYYLFEVESTKFYVIYPPASLSNKLIIEAYNISSSTPSLITSKTTTINNVTNNYQLSVSNSNMLIGYGNLISLYSTLTLLSYWSVNLATHVSAAKICQSYIFVSTEGGNIYQYNIFGTLIANTKTIFSQPKINIIENNSTCRLVIW